MGSREAVRAGTLIGGAGLVEKLVLTELERRMGDGCFWLRNRKTARPSDPFPPPCEQRFFGVN